MSRRLSPATVSCYEPERLADKVRIMILFHFIMDFIHFSGMA